MDANKARAAKVTAEGDGANVGTDDLLDFSVHRARNAKGIFVPSVAPDRCAASIASSLGNWTHFHQCRSKGPLPYGGYHWCKTHYPPTVHAKHVARNARWDAESKARREGWAREEAEKKLKDSALDAVRKIAAGHNDPRGLALEVLAADPMRKDS